MIYNIPKEDILSQLLIQLKSHFFINEEERLKIEDRLEFALAACEENFSHTENKYYWVERNGLKTCRFSSYHAVQYMIFLYYLSHDIYMNANVGQLCDKIYYLNKIFHSVDLFYAIDLPKHFSAEHPLGAVMGRAKYGDNFFFYQGCTVGGNHGIYPTIGSNCTMYANSTLLGNSHIGNNVSLGAGCLIKDNDVPDNSIVFGQSPNLIIKSKKNAESSLYFKR